MSFCPGVLSSCYLTLLSHLSVSELSIYLLSYCFVSNCLSLGAFYLVPSCLLLYSLDPSFIWHISPAICLSICLIQLLSKIQLCSVFHLPLLSPAVCYSTIYLFLSHLFRAVCLFDFYLTCLFSCLSLCYFDPSFI